MMISFEQLPTEERALYLREAAVRLNMPPVIVEKDYWVCWTLRELFSLPDAGGALTFKGGTSLSKVWGLIERFSEDIDITIDRDFLGFGGDRNPETAPSTKQRNNRLKELKIACQEYVELKLLPLLEARIRSVLPAGDSWLLRMDEADVDGQTILFQYPASLQSEDGFYVQPIVKIELGARSDTWPSEAAIIKPFLVEALNTVVAPLDCSVQVLSAERTFWEKALLIHEETFRPADKPRRARMARHYYDLWCLIQKGIASKAAKDKALFDRVAAHRQVFFRLSWVDYSTVHQGNLRLMPVSGDVQAWKQDYEWMQTAMFLDDPPPFEQILDGARQFEEEFNRV